MKLYTTDYAPNPRRVRWVMAEKGITDIAIVTLDIMTHEHKRHAAITGSGADRVPVLELDDGTLLGETLAIARYLESLYPAPNLFGHDAPETAVIEMWTRRVELNLANPLMLGVRLSHPALVVLEPPNAAVAAYFLQQATDFSVVLDRHLEGRDFIAAGRLTMADIVAACAFDFARILRYRPDKSLENLARWLTAMRGRPAAKGGV